MNILTVVENLRNTIAGKEALYQESFEQYKSDEDVGNKLALHVTLDFLALNIQELKKILIDLEQCIANDLEQSWRDNPDRAGGQFTQEEIDSHSRWI